MLDLDKNGNFYAADFPLDTLRSMTAAQRDLLNFVGFPKRYGHEALNEFFPFNPRYGTVNLPDTHYFSGKDIQEWRNGGRGRCAGREGSMQQSTTQVATTKVTQ